MTEATASRLMRQGWFQAWPLYPLVLFLLAFFLYPVMALLWVSFTDTSGAFSLANYARIVEVPVYLRVFAITFKIAGWTTLFSVLAGYPVAYLIATSSPANQERLKLLVLMPFWTSFLVRTFAWMILLGRNGAVNQLLMSLGIVNAPVALIYNFTGVMIGMVQGMMPLAIITMLSVMQNIDTTYSKAANTLGARGGQAFWRIYFPLSLPGVAAAGLLVFITALAFFITPALLGGATDTMISQVIIDVLTQLMNWRFAGALSLVLLAATAVVFFLYDRLLGISTLSGTSDAGRAARHEKPGLIAAGGAWVGRRVIAFMGGLCDRVGEAWETIFPIRSDRPRRSFGRAPLIVVVTLILIFLVAPSFFVIPVSFTSERYITFPPPGLSLRWYETYLGSTAWTSATIRSLVIALLTGVIATVLGTGAAFVMARQAVVARMALMTLVLSPLIIPRMIIAVALFYLFARLGLIGTMTGLVIGHTVIAVPYVVITVMAILKTYDERQDQASWSLGANKWQTLRHITLPQIRTGLVSGFLFAFITSFDDLTVALFVSGGSMATLPRQMWNDLLFQVNPTLAAVSTVILVVVTSFIILAERLRRRAMTR